MGVAWVFRKALHDTQRQEQGIALHGADTPSPAAMRVLRQVLSGEIPLRIQARMQHDILTALRLAKEFKLSFTLVEGTEAYKCIEELKESRTPVVFGPIYVAAPGMRGATLEINDNRLHTFKALFDAGVTTALTAHELRDEDGLARQAMYARRLGVPLAEVTRAVTSTPAAILGLSDQIGSIEAGKRADIVLWDGEPFDGTSKPVTTLVGGEVIDSASN
jgi:imidazolonepropionase-like amidohydrolase